MTDDIGLAEALLGLDDFRVLAVSEDPTELGIVVEMLAGETVFCRACGGRAEAQDRMPVQLRDLHCFGRPVRLVWRKRRWRCRESWCGNRTWTEECESARPRLLMTARAGVEVTRQVGELARPVSSFARERPRLGDGDERGALLRPAYGRRLRPCRPGARSGSR